MTSRKGQMKIREEHPEDASAITAVHRRAFREGTEGAIVRRLRRNGHLIISLVCDIDGDVVGHIAYSPVSSMGNAAGLGLGPIAVLPKFQRCGVGSELIRKGNDIAFAKGYGTIVVLGDPTFYAQFGFVPASDVRYFSKLDPSGHHFMVLSQDRTALAQITPVEYGEEFEK